MSITVSTSSYPAERTFTFRSFTHQRIDWGELSYVAETPDDTSVEARVRTAATEMHTWHEWSVLSEPGDISSLPGVVDGDGGIQVMFVLRSDGVRTPTVESFTVTGSMRN